MSSDTHTNNVLQAAAAAGLLDNRQLLEALQQQQQQQQLQQDKTAAASGLTDAQAQAPSASANSAGAGAEVGRGGGVAAGTMYPFTDHGLWRLLQPRGNLVSDFRVAGATTTTKAAPGTTTGNLQQNGAASAPPRNGTDGVNPLDNATFSSVLRAAAAAANTAPSSLNLAACQLDELQALRALQQSMIGAPPAATGVPSQHQHHHLGAAPYSATATAVPTPPAQNATTELHALLTASLRANLLGAGGPSPEALYAAATAAGLGGASSVSNAGINHNTSGQQSSSNGSNKNDSSQSPASSTSGRRAQQPPAGSLIRKKQPAQPQRYKTKKPDPPSKVVTMEEDEEDEEILIPKLPVVRPLPPLEEGDTPHYAERICVPLATEEDSNWLSERQVFIRAELLEVVRASHQDVLVRSSSKSVSYQQVGIRCRYCAHLHPSARAIRSSAYPSSIRQLYQSFTMMVRDHWASCTAMPSPLKRRFLAYQQHKIPSSSMSREYWAYAAEKIGMINTDYGITITKESMEAAEKMLSFGTTPEHIQAMLESSSSKQEHLALIHPSDQATLSPYLYLLMTQVVRCHLLKTERVGKRKDAPVGLSGFGCKHCISRGRLGFCRVFPLNKRSLPTKVNDVFCHFQRCPWTPAPTRALLRKYKREAYRALGDGNKSTGKFAERDREFVDMIWSKLGRSKGAQI